MRALIFGVEPEPQPKPDTDNRLLKALSRTPVKLVEMDDPGFIHPDWVVTKPRLTGICGSESKQIFFDYASFTSKDRGSGDNSDNPMKNFVSFPHVMGHEVVADVVAVGPEAEGLEVGDRVVLNPWLTCGPRGIDADVPRVRGGRPEPVLVVRQGRPRAGDPHRDVQGRARRLRRADARARLDAVQDPRLDQRRAGGVRRPVRGVAARHHPPPAAAGQQGARLRRRRARHVRGRDPARAVPGRRGDGRRAVRRAAEARRVARREDGRARAARGADRERSRRGRAACCSRPTGCRWRSPAASTSSTTRSARRRRSRSARACCGRAARW